MSEIETKRLLLKLYTEKEKNDFINLLTDKIVMKKVDRGVLTVSQAEALWTKLVEKMYPSGVDTIFAAFEKENSDYIGQAWIRPRPAKSEDWEIGYILKKEEWGKGFATEMARELVSFGFEKLNLPEVFATIDDDNFASIKVAEKSGMSFSRYEFDEKGRFSVYSIRKNK